MRVKNTLIVVATLLLLPIMVLGQNSAKKSFTGKAEDGWFLYYLGTDASEGYISIDRGFAIRGNLVFISTLLDYPSTGKYSVITEVYDCAGSRYTMLGKADYDKYDHEVASYDNDKPLQTYKSITSTSSRQGILLSGLCHGMPIKPASAAEARRYFGDFDKEVRKIRDEH